MYRAKKSETGLIVFNAIAAGIIVSIAAAAATLGAIAVPGAALLIKALIFPLGLVIITQQKFSLFTGNIYIQGREVLNRKTSFGTLLKVLTLSLIFNTAGAILVAGAMTQIGTQIFITQGILTAATKAALPSLTAVISGIFCNILVCLGVAWFKNHNTYTTMDKIMAAYLPVFLFVMCGFEHSVANLYYLSLGIMYGVPITALMSLIPVIIGNIIGGMLVMLLFHYKERNELNSK